MLILFNKGARKKTFIPSGRVRLGGGAGRPPPPAPKKNLLKFFLHFSQYFPKTLRFFKVFFL